MRWFGMSVLLMALVLVSRPDLSAQEEKKKDAAEVKKDDTKKDDAKKDDVKKDDTKKDEKKAAPKKEEALNYQKDPIRAPIAKFDPENNRVVYLLIAQPDLAKQAAFQQWKATKTLELLKAAPQDRANVQRQFMVETAQKQADLVSMKEVEFRLSDNLKIRTDLPPVAFDDQGNAKKLSAKDIAKLAASSPSKLPGKLPAEMDNLKPGQIVDAYLAKVDKSKTASKAEKKKRLDDDDPIVGAAGQKPEVVLIVIRGEPQPKK